MAEPLAPARAAAPSDLPAVRRHTGLVGAVLAAVVLVAAGVPTATTVLLGAAPFDQLSLGFPGLDVAITTTVLTVGAEVGCLLSIGSLVHLLFLRGALARRAPFLPQTFETRVLRAASALWAASAAGLIVFDALDSAGVPLARLGEPGAFAFVYGASYPPKAWTLSLAAALVVFFLAAFADRWTSLLVALWAAAVAVLAPVVTGQVLVGPAHDFGGDAAVFQTLAAAGSFGAVGVAAVRAASGRLVAPAALRRLLMLGTVALPVMLGAEMVLAWFKLAGSGPLDTLTGWFIVARVLCLAAAAAVAAVAGARARAGSLRERHVSRGLALSALAVAGWVGVGVAMTRQPPPQYFVSTSIQQAFLGFDVPEAPTAAVLASQWRPNLLFAGVAVAAVGVYLLAVRRLRHRGDRWPAGRTVGWLLGWAVVVVATSSGLGKYSSPDFGVHMVVHMALNMLAPGLLVLGGVVTLLLRATQRGGAQHLAGVHEWITWVLHWRLLRVVYNPLLVFVLFVGSYYGLYLTGLFGVLMPYHWAHQLMNVHFLVVGYLYYGLVVGVDRPPRPLPHIGKLGYVLAAMPFHAFFGVILMTSSTIIAETYYRYLGAPWADLAAAQDTGGGVAWAGGEIPLLIVIVILVVQWRRQDAQETQRKDRHMDAGLDDEHDAYNRMLARLAERQHSSR